MIESDSKEFRKRKIRRILIWCAVPVAITALILTITFLSLPSEPPEQINNGGV